MNISISQVSGQRSDHWQTVSQIFLNPEQFSKSHYINIIIEKFDGIFFFVYGQEQLAKERRQALWILVKVLFVNGWDNSQNRQQVMNVLNKWGIDQSVFYEMKDTVEAYRVITSDKDKDDLDTSIRNLIELG